jgi:hypothetical protein
MPANSKWRLKLIEALKEGKRKEKREQEWMFVKDIELRVLAKDWDGARGVVENFEGEKERRLRDFIDALENKKWKKALKSLDKFPGPPSTLGLRKARREIIRESELEDELRTVTQKVEKMRKQGIKGKLKGLFRRR